MREVSKREAWWRDIQPCKKKNPAKPVFSRQSVSLILWRLIWQVWWVSNKRGDTAVEREIAGWKMDLMVCGLPELRRGPTGWIMSEGFYSPEAGGISLPDTVLGDLQCRNMRRWDTRSLGPSRLIIPWLDTHVACQKRGNLLHAQSSHSRCQTDFYYIFFLNVWN